MRNNYDVVKRCFLEANTRLSPPSMVRETEQRSRFYQPQRYINSIRASNSTDMGKENAIILLFRTPGQLATLESVPSVMPVGCRAREVRDSKTFLLSASWGFLSGP